MCWQVCLPNLEPQVILHLSLERHFPNYQIDSVADCGVDVDSIRHLAWNVCQSGSQGYRPRPGVASTDWVSIYPGVTATDRRLRLPR